MTLDSSFCQKNFGTLYILFTIIVIVNILTLSSPLNMLVTIPEYLLVIYLIFSGKLRSAILLHFSFIMLSLSAQGTLGMFDTNFSLYNYGTVKLFGPVRACYLINILLFLFVSGDKYKTDRSLLYYKLYKTLLYIFLSAILIGIIGLIFNSYYSINSFIDNCVYAFAIITTCYILLRVATPDFAKSAYLLTLVGIFAAIAASFICYVSGAAVSHYSVYDIAYRADAVSIGYILIVGIPFIKHKKLLWLSLALLFILLLSSIGGKGVFEIAFSLLALVYLLFFNRDVKNMLKHGNRWLRPAVVVVFVIGAFYISNHLSEDSMAEYKIASAASIFTGDIHSISRSPYIRIASFLNILNDGLSNPLALLFGNGYGGYFEDNLNLFAGIDLSNGAWHEDVIVTGRFTSGHDMIVTVPLFNGLVGLFFMIRIIWLYIKKIPINYMNSIAFFWLAMTFYFNTILGMIGLFGLLGAEYPINETQSTKSHNS